ncbi:MAG TPA: hypothetical protein VFO20_03945, partial [Propionibacteriaceae bacterium]|nr:hypothetical protein [Propionibacteriaceae bacterium]
MAFRTIRLVASTTLFAAAAVGWGWSVLAQPAIVDLGTLPGSTYSVAADINDRGQIVGMADLAAGGSHAVLWQDGSLIDLGTLGGTLSWANAINRQGQIVGVSSLIFSSGDQATLWEDGAPHGLATLSGGNFSQAVDVNRRGQVVGVSNGS